MRSLIFLAICLVAVAVWARESTLDSKLKEIAQLVQKDDRNSSDVTECHQRLVAELEVGKVKANIICGHHPKYAILNLEAGNVSYCLSQTRDMGLGDTESYLYCTDKRNSLTLKKLQQNPFFDLCYRGNLSQVSDPLDAISRCNSVVLINGYFQGKGTARVEI
ncbi:MAG: hypothetical protein HOE90_18615 [Bacteriovoracaceae bacterium]|jgi:hypothetical protein|nr:hypothetical protein [Bacteriovoracaceae bacterium]